MGDFPHIDWPPLAEAYLDAVGPIDIDVYNTAGEIWPMAAAFAKKALDDESAGQIALLTVSARITASRLADRIHIRSLKAYIFRAYKHEVLRHLQTRRLHHEITVEKYQAITETESDDDVHKKILIEQILARMDKRNRRVFELLTLGYTFEEIAKALGKPSNSLRSAFSKQLYKIKKEIEGYGDEAC
jgi:DNA-directed RNA polymerase specialized sigma24 family protein